jgi:uncharacterized protein YukE
MGITLQGLLRADTGTLRAVADHWDRLVADIDATVEDLVVGTRDLPNHWTGAAATAAQEESTRLQAQVGNAHRYCAAIGAAVRGFADDLEQHRRLLHGIVAEAEGRGVRIDLGTGRITAPLDAGLVDGPEVAQVGVDAYVRQITEILARVNEADRRARLVIDDNVFGDYQLPGDDLPPYDEVVVLASASYDPGSRARWWSAQHQLNRDRAIEEHPEIIGAGEGIPVADRDRANRLMLRRAKADLQARQARFDEMRGGAASRATTDVDARLADIADLEERLSRPGTHLVGYQPGDERTATVSR